VSRTALIVPVRDYVTPVSLFSGTLGSGSDIYGYMESTDADLWAAMRRGDSAAFAGLFDRHARAIYYFAFRRTADWSVAEDIMAVVFLEAWRRRRQVRLNGDSALPWLYGVAVNVVRNHHRRQHRYGKVLERLTVPVHEPGFEQDLVERLSDQGCDAAPTCLDGVASSARSGDPRALRVGRTDL